LLEEDGGNFGSGEAVAKTTLNIIESAYQAV